MILFEKEIKISKVKNNEDLLGHFLYEMLEQKVINEMPIRFVVTKTDNDFYYCEIGILSELENDPFPEKMSIFDWRKRHYENAEQFNTVLLIPTGIGAEIGGHSGDGGAVAKLLASCSDTLITHPNVVNASDINELPENALYVEGSVITRLLMGTIGLQKVRSNRVMLILEKYQDSYFTDAAINSISAARVTLGINCPFVVQMDDKIVMKSFYSNSGRAVGRIECIEKICEILKEYQFQYDAVALVTAIDIPKHLHTDYFKEDLINPWGGVEAMLTHTISTLFNIPSAHSPMSDSKEILNLEIGIVDPRKSAEAVSTTNMHCILKGLHRSPRIIDLDNTWIENTHNLLTVEDISCLVIPDGCIGLPTLTALEQGIPVIAVKENKNQMKNKLEELPFVSGKLFIVDNYWEVAGIINALKSGIAPESVRRPLSNTVIKKLSK